MGAFLLFVASIVLTFGKSFWALAIYNIVKEISFMFWNMISILLRNDIIYLNQEDQYYTVRNKAKVMYGIATMITALISGYLFNLNEYLPMYITIIMYLGIFILTFQFYEIPVEKKEENKEIKENKDKKINITSTIFWVILANALFYSIIATGQSNSKLFMQYDFQKVLSTKMVTYYITIIVLVSRGARILGNIFLGKLYLKIKNKMSIVLTVLECMSFTLLILGHFIEFCFPLKVIIMSLGFCIILAIRDSYQVYIEDTALRITESEKQQSIMVDIEVYRKLGQLLINGAFTLILMKYKLIVVEFILLVLSIVEIIINKKMCSKLKKENE